MMEEFGFIKVAAASPVIKVSNPSFNINQIEKMVLEADSKGAAIAVFPELCITGYSCGDLFGQQLLLEEAKSNLKRLAEKTKSTDVLFFVGMPLAIDHKLFNCAVAVKSGRILGIVPKTYVANYKEFYEKRWFTSGSAISKAINEISFLGGKIPFGNLIFKCNEPKFAVGVELCEDLWAVIPPSSYLALQGASIIVNLSASNELVSKADYRRDLVAQQSARCICGYVYSSAGVHESTTDVVYGGECLVAENGHLLKVADRFNRENTIIYSEIDVERLTSERIGNRTFADAYEYEAVNRNVRNVEFLTNRVAKNSKITNIGEVTHIFDREISSLPFIPQNPQSIDQRCREIFNIQVAGLAKRIEHTGIKHVVLGVSGGLDSTLALLVALNSFKELKLPAKNILAVTMPGFGTTDFTYTNALQLMKVSGVAMEEIDIKPACIQHFKDIKHDPDNHNVIFENVQARERTQILMDLANKVGGLVLGTGDLSEIALGWSTFNGDQMSMYNVNCSVPKTLVRFLVKWVAENVADDTSKNVLLKILDTPISPELIPPGPDDSITQKTEDVIGPYELHDFFLYYAIRCSMMPKKVLFLAGHAFKDKYSPEEIKKWLKIFYSRFFGQQFKRSAMPDGPKVGTLSLSPRGDWRMPSDADVAIWLNNLE